MRFMLPPLLVFFVILTAACSTSAAPTPAATIEVPTVPPMVVPPTTTSKPTAVEDQPLVAAAPISECTLISSLPEPPPEFANAADIKGNEWSAGPVDAAVTLIEYGDFQ